MYHLAETDKTTQGDDLWISAQMFLYTLHCPWTVEPTMPDKDGCTSYRREDQTWVEYKHHSFMTSALKDPAATAAKSLQLCPTLCEPIDGSPPAHQAPPSLGFSRQEHWSGLPFPSPMHESEKWKWSRSVVSYPQRPHGLQPTRLLHPWDFPGKSTGVGCHCLLLERPYRPSIFLFLVLLSIANIQLFSQVSKCMMIWFLNLFYYRHCR